MFANSARRHEVPELRACAVPPGHREREDQLPHEAWVPHRYLQRHARAVAEPQEVSLRDLQVSQQRPHIVRGGLERHRRVAVGRPVVPLLLHRDHPAPACEGGDDPAECHLDGRPAAVQEQEGDSLLASVHLVVHADPVDRGMAALQRPGAAGARLPLQQGLQGLEVALDRGPVE
jgi:hypothetical protein